MLMIAFSKEWWRSVVKSSAAGDETESTDDPNEEAGPGSEEENDYALTAAEEIPPAELIAENAIDEEDRPQERRVEAQASDDDEEEVEEDSEAETEGESDSQGDDDPILLGYDSQRTSQRYRENLGGDVRGVPPAVHYVDSPKEFFNTEALYRYDILETRDRKAIEGSYRFELKGQKGGIWTTLLSDQLEVLNRREEAETVVTMQARDFVSLVNGTINPQLAILAKKLRVQGDIQKVLALLVLLAPTNE